MRPLLSLPLLFALVGCPRNVDVPDPPSGAARCESLLECNETIDGGAPCGQVRECIEGYCEETPSRVVPCASLD